MRWSVAALCAVCAAPALAGEIRLEISGCIPGEEVRVALYSSAKGFSEDRDGRYALREQAMRAEAGTVQLSFSGIAPGKYAIAAFMDSNGNHVLDSNWLGKPTELYGFSRDARGLFSPPGFEQAAFEVGEGSTAQALHLK